MADKDWTLRAISDVVKNAAVALAERDGKDPYGRMLDGREVWMPYIHEVERILLVVDALFDSVGGLPKPRKVIEIEA